jgi:hypothetical protein
MCRKSRIHMEVYYDASCQTLVGWERRRWEFKSWLLYRYFVAGGYELSELWRTIGCRVFGCKVVIEEHVSENSAHSDWGCTRCGKGGTNYLY